MPSPTDRASHGRIFYGWYMRSRTTKKAIWYGFLPRAWARHGLSPLWAQVRVSPSWSRQRLLQALSGLHEVGQAGMFEDGAESFLIPLVIPEFAGEDEVVGVSFPAGDVISRLDSCCSRRRTRYARPTRYQRHGRRPRRTWVDGEF